MPRKEPGSTEPVRPTPRTRAARLVRRLSAAVAAGAAALLLGTASAHAAGLLTPTDGTSPLTLAEQHVEVTVENGYATTGVDQVFTNPHGHDLDALYSFPVPDSAAVGELTYWIDGVAVHGEVMRKAEARALHEEQKRQGAETALLERDAYRHFEVSVSPVRAGQHVRVRLVYLQRAPLDHSVGRYVYPLEEGGVDEARDSFWTRNDAVASAFTFRMRLRSAYPVDAVRVTNGRAQVTRIDTGEWEVLIDAASGPGAVRGEGLSDADLVRALATGEGTPPLPMSPLPGDGADGPVFVLDAGGVRELPRSELIRRRGDGTRAANAGAASAGAARTLSAAAPGGDEVYRLDEDIVVYWRLAEDLPGSVDLVTHRAPGAASGTFMLTFTPGIDLAPITEGRDWVFVLDTSGSMQGKFTALTEGVRQALGALNANDRLRVVSFSDRARELTDGFVPAERLSVERVLRELDRLGPGGGTNLFDGLRTAVRSLDDDRTTALVLVTDGVANVGPTRMEDFLKLVEPLDLRLFTAVMGNSANRPLLEGLADHSRGFAVNVSNDDDIVGLMMQMASKVTHEALHDIEIDIDGVRTSALTPKSHTRVYRGEQLVVLGKYSGAGTARATLATDVSGERRRYVSELVFPAESGANPELERLWAFATIEGLEAHRRVVGETDDTRDAIVDLALGHGLVTEHTSMIVVREEVFAANGIERRNAGRVERERAARERRAAAPVVATRQDTNAPAFPSARHTTSNGGGSIGAWLLLALGALVALRLGVGTVERTRARFGGGRRRADRSGRAPTDRRYETHPRARREEA